MARDESSREDFLREATALVERIELRLRSLDLSVPESELAGEPIVAGFRRDGALSIFFGEDPVYQFNTDGELRRAYCNCKLIKATRGRLAALERVRTDHEVQLVRHDFSHDEEAAFLRGMDGRVRNFLKSIDNNLFDVVGQVPANVDVLHRLKKWFASHATWRIAAQPNA